MPEPKWDVLGFGAVTVDDLIYVDHYPLPDTKVAVHDKRRQGGGLIGTALVAAARFGARAAFAGILGDDSLSQFTLDEFRREGVDCEAVIRRADASPIHSMIIVDQNGQRGIMASFAGVQWRSAGEVTEDLIASCRVLLVDHHAVEGGLRAIELAHARDIPVVADIERESEPRAELIAPMADHLIVSINYAQRKTGGDQPEDMVRTLRTLSNHRATVVVTAGERGCWYATGAAESTIIHVPAYPVSVIDTTGCGDVFHGIYAACIAKGDDVATAIRLASGAAALKATVPGGRAGIPNRDIVAAFIAHPKTE
ncbi:MAG TPA: PfkB family carbohydrate kinase [Anaerolineae bacterium]|jgi:sugar/nucleoside kinase (ribokinase family)